MSKSLARIHEGIGYGSLATISQGLIGVSVVALAVAIAPDLLLSFPVVLAIISDDTEQLRISGGISGVEVVEV